MAIEATRAVGNADLGAEDEGGAWLGTVHLILKLAIEVTGWILMKAPTWHASCRCLVTKPTKK